MAKATTFPMACSVENPNRLCHWGAQQPPWQHGLLHCVCLYESQWPAPENTSRFHYWGKKQPLSSWTPQRGDTATPQERVCGVLGPRMPPLPPSPILTTDHRATAALHVPKLQTLTMHVLFVCLFCVYPHLGHWSQHHWGLGSAPDSGVAVSTNAPTLQLPAPWLLSFHQHLRYQSNHHCGQPVPQSLEPLLLCGHPLQSPTS